MKARCFVHMEKAQEALALLESIEVLDEKCNEQ